MLTATITIGRNIKSKPMSEKEWSMFIAAVNIMFQEVYVNAEFKGEWQGIAETSNLFIGELSNELSLKTIEAMLALIAKGFNQDAIGFIVNSRATSLIERAA